MDGKRVQGSSLNLMRNQNIILLTALLLIIPAILMCSYEFGLKNLLFVPGLNIFIIHWIHYGFDFIVGNLIFWFLLFVPLIIICCDVKRIILIVAAVMLGLPVFSFVIQMLAYGQFSLGTWGFSGILYSIYGIVVFFTVIGIYNLHKSDIKKCLILTCFLILVFVPVMFTPPIISLGNGHNLLISTLGHQMGFFWGIISCLLLFSKGDEKKIRYWYIGLIVVVIEFLRFIFLV